MRSGARLPPRGTFTGCCSVNDGVKLVFIILYICANLALFLERFFYYMTAPRNSVRGCGPEIARAPHSCRSRAMRTLPSAMECALRAAQPLRCGCVICVSVCALFF